MLHYGEQLYRALSALLREEGSIRLIAPNTQRSGQWLRRHRFGRGIVTYVSRYLRYPPLLKGMQADITHILDHGNILRRAPAWNRHRERPFFFFHVESES